MRQRITIAYSTIILATFLLSLVFSSKFMAEAGTLYGIIGQGSMAGHLITIDTATGTATLVYDTGIGQATGLTSKNSILYVTSRSTEFEGEIYVFNVPSPHQPTPTAILLSSGYASEAFAYHRVDDLFYRFEFRSGGMFVARYDADGIPAGDVGPASNEIKGLSVRPSDGVLFGAGFDASNANWLYTIDKTGGSMIAIGQTFIPILAMAFHPNDTLYGSDGSNLIIINSTIGNGTIVGSFGVSPVTGLAFVTPPVSLEPPRNLRVINP
jgi:hypothetical protein